MKAPERFPSPLYGLVSSAPGVLRYSRAIRALKDAGHTESVRVVTALYERCGNRCPVHGPLEDPILVTSGTEDIAFGCPWCSSDVVREAWEREGAS